MTPLPPMDDKTLDYWRGLIRDEPFARSRMTNRALDSLIRRLDRAEGRDAIPIPEIPSEEAKL